MDIFPAVIFTQFICMLAAEDGAAALALSSAVLISGAVLMIFRFGRNIIRIILKLAYACASYFVFINIMYFSVTDRIVYVCFLLVLIFFADRLYDLFMNRYINITSFGSLIISYIMILMLNNERYGGDMIKIIIPVIVSVNLAITYFRNNEKEMEQGSRIRQKMPSKLLNDNRIMVLAVMILAVITAFIKEIILFIDTIFTGILNMLKSAILFILRFSNSLFSADTVISEGEPPSVIDNIPKTDAKTSLIEYILFALAALILIALFSFMVIKLAGLMIKLIKKLARYLNMNMRKSMKDHDTGYVDIIETESIIKIVKEKVFMGIKDFMDNVGEQFKIKSDREMIRYLYKQKVRKLRKHGFDFSSALTPDEIYTRQLHLFKEDILNREFINEYDQARYGAAEIDSNYKKEKSVK
jgi:hypothetical protein